jgi:hypothetical protein
MVFFTGHFPRCYVKAKILFIHLWGLQQIIAWSLRMGGLGNGSSKGLGYSVPCGKTIFTILGTVPTGCTEIELRPVSLAGCAIETCIWLYLRLFCPCVFARSTSFAS